MVRVQEKPVFEGFAKIRMRAGPQGGFRICAEVDGPGADILKSAIGQLFKQLANADDAALAKMAEEMRQT